MNKYGEGMRFKEFLDHIPNQTYRLHFLLLVSLHMHPFKQNKKWGFTHSQ